MPGYGVWIIDDENDSKEFIESFSDYREAYDERDTIQDEIDKDEDAEGVRVVVVEEP